MLANHTLEPFEIVAYAEGLRVLASTQPRTPTGRTLRAAYEILRKDLLAASGEKWMALPVMAREPEETERHTRTEWPEWFTETSF